MANEPSKQTDPQQTDPQGGGSVTTDPQQTDPQEPEGGKLLDKHNEPAINKGHHDRIVAEKDARIAELEKQLEDAGAKAKDGEDALKKVEALERKLEAEKVSGALRLAGCVDEKAAKARLADFDGDVEKLKAGCPYLFGAAKQTGSTGARQGGAPSASEELVAKARAAAGTTYLYQK